MATDRSPEAPIPYVVIGAFICAVAGGLLTSDDSALLLIGVVAMALGSALALTAAVAAGVSWGMRRAR
jgi:hypothetical protein